MSARQPFVPSRPASRPAAAQMRDSFAVDTHDFPQPPKPAFMANKPLNLTGFAKNDANASQPENNTIVRPGTADIISQSRASHQLNRNKRSLASMKIVAPTPTSPFRSNVSSAMFTTDDPMFKSPALPPSFVVPQPASASVEDQTEKKSTRPPTPDASSNSLFSLSSLRFPHRSPSLDQANERTDPPGFGQDTPRASEGGPLRVLANARTRTSIGSHRRDSFVLKDPQVEDGQDAMQDENVSPDSAHKHRGPGLHKRGRSGRFDADLGDDEYIGRVKKYRADVQGKERGDVLGRQMEYVSMPVPGQSPPRQTTPSPRHTSFNQARTQSPDDQLPNASHTHLPRMHSHSASTLALSPASNHAPQAPWTQQRGPRSAAPSDSHERRQQPHERDHPMPSESAFSRIFGEGVEVYVAEQTEVYEEAQRKWEEATLQEWIAGADELAESFAKVLDFVKDHMTAKMKLYATLDGKLEAHSLILQNREKTLTQAKEDLLKSGGTLLTGGSAT